MTRKTKEPALIWEKTGRSFEVIKGRLVTVEHWRTVNCIPPQLQDYVIPCGKRVMFEGRCLSSSIVAHYLTTGEWVRRVPKPERFRAVVRDGKRTKHLGYFATVEERDAAVFAWKLGIYPSGSKNT